MIVTADIDANRHIYTDEGCRISNSLIGISGDTVLEIMRLPEKTAPGAARTLVKDGATLKSVISQDPMHAVADLKDQLTGAITTVDTAGKELDTTLVHINRILGNNEQSINNVIQGADKTLTLLQKTLHNVDNIIGDPVTQDGRSSRLCRTCRRSSRRRSTPRKA